MINLSADGCTDVPPRPMHTGPDPAARAWLVDRKAALTIHRVR
jgi:hypothetical protein